MEKVLHVLKRFGAFLLAFIIGCSWVVCTIGWQGIVWAQTYHPGESWWSLGVASLIVSGFAFWPSFQTVKLLVKIAMDQ